MDNAKLGLLTTLILGIFILIGALMAFLIKKKNKVVDFSIGLAILYELGEANQIAYYYKDNPDLIYEHFHLLSEKTKCFFNSLKETGCPYVLLPGVYRLYFNGFLDKAIKRIRYEKMEKLKKNNYAYE